MFCKNCGNTISETSLFCTNCGASTNSKASPAQNTNFPFSPNVQPDFVQPKQNNKSINKTLIICVSILFCAIILFVSIFLINKLGNKKNSLDKRDEIVKNGYVTNESDHEDAFNTLVDTFIQATYEHDYDVFKACRFPGDYASDRASLSKYNDTQFMDLYAPIHPDYDTFTSWSISNADMKLIVDKEKIIELQEDYKFEDDWTFSKHCSISFDLTLKSDIRTVTMPCKFEIVYSSGHWYIWYSHFDVENYYKKSYSYSGEGNDKFAIDYEPKDK